MAKKTTGTIRTTISIPADLKRRMDQVTEPINWSSLACQAFQQKLGEIAARKETKTMADVVERLRASKRISDSEQYRGGHAVGEEWAKREAHAQELDLLDSFQANLGSDWDGFFDSSVGSSAYSAFERLYFKLHPEDDGDRQAARDFRESVTGDDAAMKLSDEFLRGFAEGALSVWHDVKDQL